jgi:hypothetical protein
LCFGVTISLLGLSLVDDPGFMFDGLIDTKPDDDLADGAPLGVLSGIYVNGGCRGCFELVLIGFIEGKLVADEFALSLPFVLGTNVPNPRGVAVGILD